MYKLLGIEWNGEDTLRQSEMATAIDAKERAEGVLNEWKTFESHLKEKMASGARGVFPGNISVSLEISSRVTISFKTLVAEIIKMLGMSETDFFKEIDKLSKRSREEGAIVLPEDIPDKPESELVVKAMQMAKLSHSQKLRIAKR